MTERHDLVGSREIAGRLGVSIRTVQTWRMRHVMPEPEYVVSGVPVWNWETIRQWSEHRGRAATE